MKIQLTLDPEDPTEREIIAALNIYISIYGTEEQALKKMLEGDLISRKWSLPKSEKVPIRRELCG